MDDTRYQRAMEGLFSRLNYERTPDAATSIADFRLNTIRRLLAALGNPQSRLPTVHLAGSKGKGSTATMVARIAEAAGYRVGLFTSPHVDRFEERFTVNGTVPEQRDVADLYDHLQQVVQKIQKQDAAFLPTFFEMSTAMGWMHFTNQHVDLAVIEVGLGGRLDSTNICNPAVTVITSISRDHTRLLGETLAAIAREKAGIIKPGVPVVTHVTDPAAARATEEIARQQGVSQFRLGTEFHCRPHRRKQGHPDLSANYRFDFQGMGIDWRDLELGMPGEHQTQNGALAVATTQLLAGQGWKLPETAVRQGLKNARCPLRVEVIHCDPLLIVDVAHNPASIAALCATIHQMPAQRRLVIFSSSRDKEAETMLRTLNETADEIWLTQFTTNPRAVELHELKQMAERILTCPWRIQNTPATAIAAARTWATPRDLICITGSFFLAAEAKSLLGTEASRPE